MKYIDKIKSYLHNETIMKDTKFYSCLIIGTIYFLAFFKFFMGDSGSFSLSGLIEVTLWIVPLSVIGSFWYSIHEFNQKSDDR